MGQAFNRTYPIEKANPPNASGPARYRAGAVGPHLATIRWTITLPGTHAGWIESALVSAMRQTAPVTAGQVEAWIEVVDNGTTDVLYVTEVNAATGVQIRQNVGHAAFVAPNGVVNGVTVDPSTGGTYHYDVAAMLRQFEV